MSRSLPEWIAKSDDEPVPARVRLRIFTKFSGVCPVCHRNLRPGHWEIDHTTALINGGENREKNLRPVCIGCHVAKTSDDLAEKSTTYRRQLAQAGIRRRRSSFLTNKDGPLKKTFNKGTVRR